MAKSNGAGADLLAAVMAAAKDLRLKKRPAPSGAYFSLMKGKWNAAYIVPGVRSVRMEVHASADDLPKNGVAVSKPYSGGDGWRCFTVKTVDDLPPALTALEIAAGKGGK